MNERIKELAEQAGAVEAKHITNTLGDMVLVGEEEIEKFAELIVKKCAMIGNYAHDGGEYPGPIIKEYFGVE